MTARFLFLEQGHKTEPAMIAKHDARAAVGEQLEMLFLAVAFTSVRVARKKLKRETWYFVHLYAYLAVALTFAHQLALGSDFDNDRAARAWWIGLYLLVFGAIVLTSLIFGAMHTQYTWLGMLDTAAWGLMLGIARWRSGSTVLTIIMHAAWNLACAMTVALSA